MLKKYSTILITFLTHRVYSSIPASSVMLSYIQFGFTLLSILRSS